MKLNKKSISPVISVMLLVLVAVLATLSLNGWVSEFQSKQRVEVQTQINNLNNIKVFEVGVVHQNLNSVMISNKEPKNIKIDEIQIIKGNETCRLENIEMKASSIENYLIVCELDIKDRVKVRLKKSGLVLNSIRNVEKGNENLFTLENVIKGKSAYIVNNGANSFKIESYSLKSGSGSGYSTSNAKTAEVGRTIRSYYMHPSHSCSIFYGNRIIFRFKILGDWTTIERRIQNC